MASSPEKQSHDKARDRSWIVPIVGLGVAQAIVAAGCLIALAAAPPDRPMTLGDARPHAVRPLAIAEQVAQIDVAALLLPQGEAGPHWQSPAGIQYDANDPFHVSVSYVDDAQFGSPRTLLIDLAARKEQFDESELASELSERGLTPVPVAGLGTGPAVSAATKADDGQATSTYVFTMAQPDQIVVSVALSGEDVDAAALEFARAEEQYIASALRACQSQADTCQIEGATHDPGKTLARSS
jgi:hypothetical protein